MGFHNDLKSSLNNHALELIYMELHNNGFVPFDIQYSCVVKQDK